MQKFTVFTIIVSVIILSMTAELVAQDYLKKLWPPSVSANLLKQIEADEIPLITQDPQTDDEIAEEPETDTEDLPAPVQDDEPDDTNAPDVPVVTDEIALEESSISSRILELLPTIDYGVINLQPINYSGNLFELLPTEGINPDSVALGQLVRVDSDPQETLGAIYEFNLESQVEARKLYVDLKSQARSFTEIEVNETNQFGDNSFYLNHKAKVGQVFLITLNQNKLYALAYKTNLHEVVKPFLGLLL